jgi:hypothetical protein
MKLRLEVSAAVDQPRLTGKARLNEQTIKP